MTCVSSGTTSLDGGNVRPDPEIDRIAADHPAQEQIQPLARASARRAREEVARRRDAASGCHTPGADSVCERARGKRFERAGEIGALGIVTLEKERLDRSLLQHALKDEDERGEIVALRPAMDDRLEVARLPSRIERAHVRRGRRPHHGEQPLDRLQHARDTSERERRGAESRDLAIGGIFEAADELYGVGGGIDAVERAVERVEPLLQRPTRLRDRRHPAPTESARRPSLVVHVDRPAADDRRRHAALELPSAKRRVARLRAEPRRIDRDLQIRREHGDVRDGAFAERSRREH